MDSTFEAFSITLEAVETSLQILHFFTGKALTNGIGVDR